MNSVMKFLLRTYCRVIFLASAAMALAAVVLNVIFPDYIFTSYLASFPMFEVIFSTVYGIQLSSLNLTTALTMGSRRRDFNLAAHICIALTAAVSLMVIYAVYRLDLKLHLVTDQSYYYRPEDTGIMAFYLLSGQIIGMGCSTLTRFRRVLTSVVFGVILMVLTMSFVFQMLSGIFEWNFWGDLTYIITGLIIVLDIAAEVLFQRMLPREVVR
ncbi:MAG: hypothetical protein ACOX81_07670 [Candidatus Heteroscillospira sp.]|jgi:hypothetical protein